MQLRSDNFETEKNLREALASTELLAPCVL